LKNIIIKLLFNKLPLINSKMKSNLYPIIQKIYFSTTKSLRVDPLLGPTLLLAAPPVIAMAPAVVAILVSITLVTGLTVTLLVLSSGLGAELSDAVMSRTQEEFEPLINLFEADLERITTMLEAIDPIVDSMSIRELEALKTALKSLSDLHEEVFNNVSTAVDNCEEGHPEFGTFNDILEEFRGAGNAIVERFRDVEAELQKRGQRFGR
jgi:hypothetical protein